MSECSPPTRGSPADRHVRQLDRQVFPAHAGISRLRGLFGFHRYCVPRPRGDLPLSTLTDISASGCSPPTRGSPGGDWDVFATADVFPAHAGISRGSGRRRSVTESVPRPRGDLPTHFHASGIGGECSPPTRGSPAEAWTKGIRQAVFPAHAGISRA